MFWFKNVEDQQPTVSITTLHSVDLAVEQLLDDFDRLPYSIFYAVWPELAIYCTLGNFSKPVGTIILHKLPTVLGKFSLRFKNLSFC